MKANSHFDTDLPEN